MFEVTTLYYDKYARVVQSRGTNHLSGYDLVYNQLDFSGKPTKTLKNHNIAGQASVVELYTYGYNKAQQPTTSTYSLNGGSAVTLASNTYDELGRLTGKTRHSNADAESYAYNVRGWTTSISSGGFTENLFYNTNPLNSNVTFNGNISYSNWTYNGVSKGYLYGYDGLNRLLDANFKQGTSGLGDDSFNENFTYDKMGNILTLKRKKNYTQIDDLAFHYTNNEKSNQLQYVVDAGATQGQYLIKEYQNKSNTQNEFTYDANGNMTKDFDREIETIRYNVLNLPDVVQFKNGNQIKNTYNAGGQKLGTEYFTWQPGANAPLVNTGDVLNLSYLQGSVGQNGIAYIGNVEYNTQNGNSSLTAFSRIYNTEGYVENLSNPQYYYYRKDHLGNNREVWLANNNSTVQKTQYYPSGLPITYNDGDNPRQQRMKYNGKEFDEMHGYDTYDYGARGYYAALNILPTVDPLAEKYYSSSPYAYCLDNPIKYIDPNGENPIYALDGTFLGTDDEGISGMSIIMDKKNFTQGMKHAEVWKYNFGEEALKANGTFDIYLNHYSGLINRPDYDGFVTAEEGIAWAKEHPNALTNHTPDNTLYINTALLDFGNVATSDFVNGVGKSSPINLLSPSNIIDAQFNEDLYNTVYALGRVDMILLNKSDRTVKIVNNDATDYDWNTGGGFIRNTLITRERNKQGLNDTHGFKVFYYGIGRLKLTLKDM